MLVRGDTTLLKLHKIIQAVMPWEDNHLHQFIVGDECYSIHLPEDPLPRGVKNKSRENTPIAHKIRQILMFPGDVKNESHVNLSQIAPAEKAKFIYEYDFEDSWVPPDTGGEDPASRSGAEASCLSGRETLKPT
ncbi:plasmid pRiA4b ORF-3 family protein [Methanothrix sp.]|uniref:plasmid pRiA4b ORF-3 family protein n=1 Tax=Methanothrix sp. TaxID=90426 RepID=UPI003C78AE9D